MAGIAMNSRTLMKVVLGIGVPTAVGWLIMTTTTPSRLDSAAADARSAPVAANGELIRQLREGADKHANGLQIRTKSSETK